MESTSVFFIDLPASPTDNSYRNIGDVTYVGITELSVEVHTSKGERIRITNADFAKGMVIERKEKEA